MENIISKIQKINYEANEKASINKFMTPLYDEIVSLEDLTKILDYLNSNGIYITKPSQNKIFANTYDEIVDVVESYKEIGILKALIDDPTRINAKDSIKRIKYLMKKGEILNKPNGKFLAKLFSKRLFEKEYGPLIEEKEEVIEFDPLQDHLFTKEENTDESSIYDLFKAVDTFDEYEAVLREQQVPADDEAIKRFDNLYNYAEKVLNKLYQVGDAKVSVPDNVCTYLMKLVSQKMPDDKKVLYYALTYGKTLTESEESFINSKINEVLNENDIFSDIELGSVQ